ncbi:DUF6082 family protein [Streptomyces sp. NBC_01237]|uniref:DUF6082 family protein n=1 Tax=Streptomyces sp. NBC_01237 TaxID=2903790 RepID=UPI002DD89E3A|nr:DUF6082 family protein [Streptomyces sp. NBC_01237]WRZ77637.1 DUF6082 family protein [Streptomyces sp. NBC_01237]
MKTSHSVLVAAVVGTAGLVLSERQNRRRLALQAAEMHQTWIAELAGNPELRAVWAPPGGELPDEEHKNLLHANRLISLLAAKFRAGLFDRHSMRVQAQWLMEREIARIYWRTLGSLREGEAIDRTDRMFNAILSAEYTAAVGKDPVAA